MAESGNAEKPIDARTVARTLAGLDMRPTRGRGQNFLIDQSVVRRIVDALDPSARDHVVEVGPGLGILTAELLRRSGDVAAIEIDDRLATHLREEFPDERLRLVVGDALAVPPESFIPESGNYLFAANLPYSAGSAIIRRFLELPSLPERMVVMVQKEVAERMTASPPKMSILGVSIQVYSRASMAFDVPPSAFKPRPNVTSSVVLLEPFGEKLLPRAERQAFFDLVHAGFHQKRKQLGNTLSSGLGLSKPQVAEWLSGSGVSPGQRAESLDVDTWLALHATRPDRG